MMMLNAEYDYWLAYQPEWWALKLTQCPATAGVTRDASSEEIKKQYYILARRLHPDKTQTTPWPRIDFRSWGRRIRWVSMFSSCCSWLRQCEGGEGCLQCEGGESRSTSALSLLGPGCSPFCTQEQVAEAGGGSPWGCAEILSSSSLYST